MSHGYLCLPGKLYRLCWPLADQDLVLTAALYANAVGMGLLHQQCLIWLAF